MVEHSMACILSFFKQIRIQLEVLYDIIKGAFLISTKFQSDVMRCCSVVAESKLRNVAEAKYEIYKEQATHGHTTQLRHYQAKLKLLLRWQVFQNILFEYFSVMLLCINIAT